jgi:hypothetical protein
VFSRKGKLPVDLNGEYRAVIEGGHMLGAWISNGQAVGEFKLVRVD